MLDEGFFDERGKASGTFNGIDLMTFLVQEEDVIRAFLHRYPPYFVIAPYLHPSVVRFRREAPDGDDVRLACCIVRMTELNIYIPLPSSYFVLECDIVVIYF